MAKTFPRASAGRSISHVGKSRPWLREPNKTKCIDEQSPSVHSYQKSINDRGGWDGKNKTKRNGEFVSRVDTAPARPHRLLMVSRLNRNNRDA